MAQDGIEPEAAPGRTDAQAPGVAPQLVPTSVLFSTSFQLVVGLLWGYTGLAAASAVAEASGAQLVTLGQGTASLGWLVWWVMSGVVVGASAAACCTALALTSEERARRLRSGRRTS